MKTVKFYGASDDLVEVEGIPGADEFWCDTTCAPFAYATFVVGGKVRVRAIYDGCWSFAVGQVDEDLELPAWPIRITQHADPSYSVLLEIDVPDDTSVMRVECAACEAAVGDTIG